MIKRGTYIIIGVVFILAFLAGSLVLKEDPPFKLGLDLQGGAHLVYQADLTGIEPPDRAEAMAGLRDVIERRVNLFGVKEPLVQVQEERLIVELPGVIGVEEAVRLIGQTPFLEFREQREEQERQRILAKREEIEEFIGKEIQEMTEEDWQKVQVIEEWQLALEDPLFKPTILTGKYLERAEVGFGHPVREPIILLQFNEEGAKIFEELTARNIGKPLAIYIDQVMISAPVVQEKIVGGRAQISGNFTIEEARELARNLNAGALPLPIELIFHQNIGPILGKISLEKSLKAGLFGLLLVAFFLIFIYRLPGALAVLALTIYLVFILALFKLIPVTLTLAGIAGVILSIGLAVDANILIFSRMREELKEGKNPSIALEEGFRRAWPSIRDGNFTTLIVALILFGFGTSFVKGFALTLTIGILISMFSAIIITKNLLRCFSGTKLEKVKILWH